MKPELLLARTCVCELVLGRKYHTLNLGRGTNVQLCRLVVFYLTTALDEACGLGDAEPRQGSPED